MQPVTGAPAVTAKQTQAVSIQTRYMCLQQFAGSGFIVFGQQHMDHLVSEMVAYYHEERPHHSKDNDPLVLATLATESKKTERKNKESSPDAVPISQIDCRQRLGGVLRHYYRKAS